MIMRLIFLLILAVTLTACDGGNNVARDEPADPMAAPNDDTTFSDLVEGHSKEVMHVSN